MNMPNCEHQPHQESWLPAPGYEGLYEVSSDGRIRSLDHLVKNRYSIALRRGRILKQSPDKRGYMQAHLSKGNEVSTVKVHRIVATAFLGIAPAEDAQVNHKDCRKDNNAFTNLEWCSRGANHRHAVENGRLDGAISPARGKKLTAEDARSIRAAGASGETHAAIAKRFGIARETAAKIIRRQIWLRA